MSGCIHLERTEAFVVAGSHEGSIHYTLCGWADANPERLAGMPRWALVELLSSSRFSEARDCPRCPAFQPQTEQERP